MKETNDEKYWESYYKLGVAPEEPSLFAQFINDNVLQPTDRLIELGCGNGRDSKYFANLNPSMSVTAIDQCADFIENSNHENLPNLNFITGDFTKLPDGPAFNIVYSRFTLHSISKIQQERTLAWANRNLTSNGTLCIETRGQKNEFFQLGKKVEGENNAFIYEDHYRRFVELGSFVTEVTMSGFDVIFAEENRGYAPFNGSDQHFIRLFAKNRKRT